MAKRFLLAWELGAGFGHLTQLTPFAEHLRKAGHACAFAVRHLSAAENCLPSGLGPCFQAPTRLGPAHNPVRTQVSYASLLHNIGFDNPTELAARLRAWRELLRMLRTEFVIATHSPLALIAAQSMQIPTMEVGTGFTVPPATTPYPCYPGTGEVASAILEKNEAAVLQELNQALERLKLAPMETLQTFHRQAQRRLLSYAPLDHYPDRKSADDYYGRPPFHFGEAPKWPSGSGRKLFVYLRPGPLAQPLLQALTHINARVLIRLDGLDEAGLQGQLPRHMSVTSQSIHTGAAAEQCDAYIGMGAHGLSCDMALAGKPGLNLPHSMETSLLSRALLRHGAGLMVPPDGADTLQEHVDRLLEDDSLGEAAQRLIPADARPQAEEIVRNALSLWV